MRNHEGVIFNMQEKMSNTQHITFSGIPHITAGVFLMKDITPRPGRYMILVDEEKSLNKIMKIMPLTTEKPIRAIAHIGDIIALSEEKDIIALMHTNILR